MYSWVWKKSSVKNRDKTFSKVTALISEMNKTVLSHSVKFGIRDEYAIEYLEEILIQYICLTGIRPDLAVRGRGHHKSAELRYYDRMTEYIEKLKNYAHHIKVCGDERNSYMKYKIR